MKILYITNQICGAGGLERVLSIKASYLADNFGYEVHIATLNQYKKTLFFDFSDKINYHDIAVFGNFIKYFYKYISGLNRIIIKIKPDVIIVCDDGLKAFFLPIFLKKTCPIVYERHVSKNISINENDNQLQKLKIKFSFLLMNFLGKFFTKFIVLTKGNIQEWKLKNIEVIANPLTFYPLESSTLKNKTVIAVGKQSYQKGYDRLLKSWQIVNKTNPDWKLKIYGTIDEKHKLNQLKKELNIDDSVCFFPAEKNIESKFLEASIFALSSRYEGFGMVIIEAMACGLPTVSFDCPCGPKDIILNGIDGFLVENNNIEEFAKKINFLIENENSRIQFGEKSKQNVKRFLPEIIMKSWDDLFKNLVK